VVVEAEVRLEITLLEPRSVAESMTLLHQIETLISLLCFDYIKAEQLKLAVQCKENGKDRTFTVTRARFIEGGKSEIDWKKLPVILREQDFGALLDKFVSIYFCIEQTLDWYRIVRAEDRYEEDKFFYAIRMIEGAYRALNVKHKVDEEALSLVERVLAKCRDDAELVKFMNERVAGMFKKRWDLPQIIRDLKERYAEMCAVEFLDPVRINRLRGKEAHGGSGGNTAGERTFMVHTYDLLITLYVLLVLENCGLAREFLLKGLRSTHAHFFSERRLQELIAAASSP
jgi:hypothetical protein